MAMTISDTPAWQALAAHAEDMRPRHLRELFAEDPGRFEALSLAHGELLLDFSKQRVTPATLDLLRRLAATAELPDWMDRMRGGEPINHTENRAVLHIALRAPAGSPDSRPEVEKVLERLGRFCDRVHNGDWRGFSGERISDVVNIGIGGSDLGPKMVAKALSAWHHPDLRLHFVSNVDSADLAPLLAGLNPRTTLFTVASKTFTTLETMANAHTARNWILAAAGHEGAVARHFVAVSTNVAAAGDFGIPPESVFEFWDWVGGRFSLWSAIGLPVALAVGFQNFRQLLAGAHDMDRHFFTTPPARNLPLTLALLGIWNTSFLGASSHAVLPYSQSLALLPAHLQQLEMESNGKQVNRYGEPVGSDTCPILWGEAGTNGQHSFYQLIHQGGRLIPCDFIALKEADFPLPGHHGHLLANCLAQSAALAFGQTLEEVQAAGVPENLQAFKVFPGNQPSSTLVLPRLDPFTVGQLVALYEHKVFCQGVIWELNSFDQWGVELGKQLAGRLTPVLAGKADTGAFDASTRGLIAALRQP